MAMRETQKGSTNDTLPVGAATLVKGPNLEDERGV
jgi:hypothetical protein